MWNTDKRWGGLAQLFHWVIAALMVTAIIYAWQFDDAPAGPIKGHLVSVHKAIGVTILALVVLRLMWRELNPVPALPAGMSRLQALTAQVTHGLLYFVMFAMPISGLVMSLSAGHPVDYFGLFTIPALAEKHADVAIIADTLHVAGQWAVYALVVLHTVGALYHEAVTKDDVLRRMLPFTGARRKPVVATLSRERE